MKQNEQQKTESIRLTGGRRTEDDSCIDQDRGTIRRGTHVLHFDFDNENVDDDRDRRANDNSDKEAGYRQKVKPTQFADRKQGVDSTKRMHNGDKRRGQNHGQNQGRNETTMTTTTTTTPKCYGIGFWSSLKKK